MKHGVAPDVIAGFMAFLGTYRAHRAMIFGGCETFVPLVGL